jgi:hypothetical protein
MRKNRTGRCSKQLAKSIFGSSSERTKRETKGGFEGADGKVQGADPEAAAQAAATEQRLEEKNLFESAERSVEMSKLINLSAPSFGDSKIKTEKILAPFWWHQSFAIIFSPYIGAQIKLIITNSS